MRRRSFVQTAVAAVGGLPLSGCGDTALPSGIDNDDRESDDGRTWLMPAEGQPHKRTWMAFAAHEQVWGAQLVPEVQRSLASIATTIARFEPVSMLVSPAQMGQARALVSATNVELVPADLDDLWLRDSGPVFVTSGNARAGVDFNFNGWGGKQDHDRDAKVARVMTQRAAVPIRRTELVLEGGALEVDGEGTAIITESCVLNENRNPGWTKHDVDAELGRLLGIKKVIWLPGVAGKDITDGHTDWYARFTSPGVVVAGLETDPQSYDYEVTRRHLDILHAAADCHGRPLHVEVLAAPSRKREKFTNDDFAAGYINFYVCNGAVIGPEFGDSDADAAAKRTLERIFARREVVQINIDGIAAGGGGIHCATQQEPAD